MKSKAFSIQTLFYLSVILICINLISCIGPKKEIKKIDPAVLDFCDFKNGSYWVYEDTFGNIDSTWVSDYANSAACEGPESGALCVQNILYYINSSQSTNKIKADIQPDFSDNSTGCVWYNVASRTSYYQIMILVFKDTIFKSSSILEHYNTYTVNGIVYNDVYLYKSSIYEDADFFILAKNVGFIEKGSVKFPSKLIRYNIVR